MRFMVVFGLMRLIRKFNSIDDIGHKAILSDFDRTTAKYVLKNFLHSLH